MIGCQSNETLQQLHTATPQGVNHIQTYFLSCTSNIFVFNLINFVNVNSNNWSFKNGKFLALKILP